MTKSKHIFQVLVMVAVLFAAMGSTHAAFAQTDPPPVVVVLRRGVRARPVHRDPRRPRLLLLSVRMVVILPERFTGEINRLNFTEGNEGNQGKIRVRDLCSLCFLL